MQKDVSEEKRSKRKKNNLSNELTTQNNKDLKQFSYITSIISEHLYLT
jgi:hypothetical protein